MNYVFYKERDGKVVATEIVPEEDIKRVAIAAKDVVRVCRVEEIFHMIMSALQEFNAEVLRKADQERVAYSNVVENELFRVHINQCAASFLTAIEMYQEYLCTESGDHPFSISFDKFSDDRFEVCKAIRNYIQHASTIAINISCGGVVFARGERMCSFTVSADTEDMKENKDKMRKASWKKLNRFIEGKRDLNLYDVFNSVVDVLFAIQKDVRASKEYAVEYKNSAQFLAQLHERLILQGFTLYRYEGDDENKCRGHVPYFYHRQREMISYLCRRYTGSYTTARFYATTAPQEMINRIAEADRIVWRYVKDNGVVAAFNNGVSRITDSQFTTKKMRDWYLRQKVEDGMKTGESK